MRRYEVPVDSPESVIYDRQTNAFYGGSSNPDGTVYKVRLDGERLDGRARVFMRPGEDGTGEPATRTQTEGFNFDKEATCT